MSSPTCAYMNCSDYDCKARCMGWQWDYCKACVEKECKEGRTSIKLPDTRGEVRAKSL